MDDASRGARRGPPPPPRSSARPSPAGTSGGRSVGPPTVRAAGSPRVGAALVPFGLLAAAAVAAIVLAWWSWANDAGRTSELSPSAIAGWLTGGVVALIVFAWFRASTMARQADPYYIEPSW